MKRWFESFQKNDAAAQNVCFKGRGSYDSCFDEVQKKWKIPAHFCIALEMRTVCEGREGIAGFGRERVKC